MANIENKTNLETHTGVENNNGAPGVNWISQIEAGNTVYDIATHHGITFVDGNGGTKTTWNGVTDIEVVIPTIKDIVQSPIEFAGVVGADGEVDWNDTHNDGPKTGYLVFVTADCEFAGQACEAGDMAIYDGTKWNIVSGENQVTITGTTNSEIAEGNRTVVAIGAAKDVLEVEGKALALTLDYADLDTHVELTTGETFYADVESAKVKETYVKLEQAASPDPIVIAENVSIAKATGLKSGEVTFNNPTVVKEVNFGTFTEGEMPKFTKNSEKTFNVTGGSLTPYTNQTDGVFVDSITSGDVTFVKADESDENKIKVVTGIVSGDGAEFFNGFAETKEGETADLTVEGYIKPTEGVDAKYVKGLEDNKTTVVTSITEGSFKLTTGATDIVTGFGDESNESGDVLSNVTVTANNNTSVLNSATVKDHVLSFGTANVASDVTVGKTYKSLVKSGFEYVAPVATDTKFVTAGFEKVADKKYTFSKGKETTYTVTDEMWKLSTPELVVTKGKYSIDHTSMKATVPAETFVASYTDGVVPSWTGYGSTPIDLTGSVSTELTYEDVDIHAVKSGVESITLPGAYSLTSASAAGDNAVLVGAAGDLDEIKVSVNLESYVTDVEIKA